MTYYYKKFTKNLKKSAISIKTILSITFITIILSKFWPSIKEDSILKKLAYNSTKYKKLKNNNDIILSDYITSTQYIIKPIKHHLISIILFIYTYKFFMNEYAYFLLFNNNLFRMLFILIISLSLIVLIPKEFKNLLKTITFYAISISYFISLFLWLFFDRTTPKFQYIINFGKLYFLNTDMIFAIDGLSLFFILLTTLISPLLVLVSWYLTNNVKLLMTVIITAEIFTILTFTALDLFLFFIVFEGLLIPLFLSILIWGSGERRIKASIMLFLYTLLSSLLFMIAIFSIYLEVGSTNFFAILNYNTIGFSFEKQKFLWTLLFIAFAVKIPLYPLHTWLPEAHVEAPTFGSVILASLLLKTGGYGLFRYVIPIFPEANIYYTPIVYCLALIGVIYAALSSLRQLDIKRIVAYLSVSHMNFCVLGQFSENLEGIIGSILLMIAHGIIAAGFFISIGILYKRYHIRLIHYYGGLTRVMPVFAILLFILTLGNMNMPGTSNFVGELLILIGVGHKSLFVTLLAAIGSAFGALCTIWLWSKLMFNEIKLNYLIKFKDLSRKEFFVLLPLILINFIIGLMTNELIDTIYVSIYYMYTFLII